MHKRSFLGFFLFLAWFVIFFTLQEQTPVTAASIVVNSPADIEADDGLCTLREAIFSANSNTASGTLEGECAAGSDADTIILPDGIYSLDDGDLSIASTIEIVGIDAEHTIIQASTCDPITLPGGCTPAYYRVFSVQSTGDLTLDSLTVRYGNGLYGGGIWIQGILTVKNSTISDNYASENGGGIYDNGILEVEKSTFSGNHAKDLGGGIFIVQMNSANISGSSLSNNQARLGGGIFNYGNLDMTGSTLSKNKASELGGGLYNTNEDTETSTILESNLTENEAAFDGGGIYNQGNLSVTSSEFTENKADYGGGIRNYQGNLSVESSTFTNNFAEFSAGGIINDEGYVNLLYCTFDGNSTDPGGYGGGITNMDEMDIRFGLFTGNTSGEKGGGIRNAGNGSLDVEYSTFFGNHSNYGGGILNDSGTVTIDASTFNTNTADFFGGGILNNDSLSIKNSTFFGNSAVQGGGIININGFLILWNCTISENSASIEGGGIFNAEWGTLDYDNTLIADSVNGGDCVNDGGTIRTNRHNLVEDGGCEAELSGDPMLGPLADNGGFTLTQSLLPGSPAIDAGDDDICPLLDQREFPRPLGAGCDIGAFEVNFLVAAFTGDPTNGNAPLQVTFTNQSTGYFDTCVWEFGDGVLIDDCNHPTHTYDSPGSYTVKLSVLVLGEADTLAMPDYIHVYGHVNNSLYLPLVLK